MSDTVRTDERTGQRVRRRDFLKTTAAAAAGFTIVPRHVLGAGMTAPSDRLNIAGVGVGGMGRVNLTALSTENIVALCDVDWDYAGRTLARLPAEIQEREGQVKSLGSDADRKEMLAVDREHQATGGSGASSQALHRLPRDARQAEGHRRGHGGHARSHARGHRAGGHGPRQARVRAEAAHLVRGGSSKARAEGRGIEGRHTDGQSGPLVRRCPSAERVHLGWRHRRRARGARLDRPAARILATSRSAARTGRSGRDAGRRESLGCRGPLGETGRGDGRRASRAGHARLGSVSRGCAVCSVPPRLPPLQLARLGRLGRGSARRHGRASDRPRDVGARSRISDVGRNGLDAVQQGVVSGGHRRLLRVPGAGQPAAGQADVVRRRSASEETRGDRQRGARQDRRRPVHRHQGQAAVPHLGGKPAPAARRRCTTRSGCRRRSCRASPRATR